jgi:hypothetical protein
MPKRVVEVRPPFEPELVRVVNDEGWDGDSEETTTARMRR